MPPREYYFPQRRLVSQEDASLIEDATVPRSKFIGAWTRKTTFDAGYLVPFLIEEILPGDHMQYNVTAYVRMSTPLFPLFDTQRIDTFFFFVPNRLVWTNWVRFMGEQDDPADTIAYTIPTVIPIAGGPAVGSIYDHMGIPTAGQIPGAGEVDHSALPFRAYNLIYNLWFRDQNIQNGQVVNLGDGPDGNTTFELLRRAKSHDYFTSALPWPQKFTAPTVPLGGLAPVIGIGVGNDDATSGPQAIFQTTGAASYAAYFTDTSQGVFIESQSDDGTDLPAIFADLSATTGVAINTFRQAIMVQSLLERDARGGTRYAELIQAHFRVRNPDARLQRPEYIGGGQTPLQITPIAQTAEGELPVGSLGGTGTAVGSHRASYASTEHGYIIGLINVRSELSYQQGLHKMWSRSTRFDFYWPSLAMLGEQAVLRKEIYMVGDDGTLDNIVFGYQERWHEYRTRTSEVTGLFRSTETGNIDEWHLAQQFSAPPTLSSAFIVDDPPMARVLAAGAEALNQQYLADILIQRTAVRPLPMFGTPATLGRF